MEDALIWRWAAAVAAPVLSAGGSWLLVRHSSRLGISDIPNERSSHAVAKPRTGGIAIFTALAAALGLFWIALGRPNVPRGSAALLVGGAAFFALGLCEDIFHLSEKLRLAIQIALALAAAGFGPRIAVLALPGRALLLPRAAALALTAFWYVGFVNVFNFLDGIDGYAAGEALCAGFFFTALSGSFWPLLVALAAAGFLLLNFEPARLFMGDSGSYLLGFALAAACVQGSEKGGRAPFLAFALVLAAFIVDAAATLAKRMARMESWMKPHRSHYYQRMTDLGFCHAQVSLMNMGLSVLLGVSALVYVRTGAGLQWLIIAAWAADFALIIAWIESAAHRRFVKMTL